MIYGTGEKMILIKSLNQHVSSRKEAKKLLGGTNAYNRALKNKDIIFINNNIANNDKRRNRKIS